MGIRPVEKILPVFLAILGLPKLELIQAILFREGYIEMDVLLSEQARWLQQLQGLPDEIS
jgi:hypothetical protein